jgi:hypothetical protein
LAVSAAQIDADVVHGRSPFVPQYPGLQSRLATSSFLIKRTCRVSRWKQIHVPARLPFEWSAVNDVEAIAGQQRVQTRVALLGIWDQYL